MATIQELIDNGEVMLGKTEVEYINSPESGPFIPHFRDKEQWVCQMVISGNTNKCMSPNIRVHQPPWVEMEDRWLWATKYGKVSDSMWAKEPGVGYTIKIECTKTQFPKD